MKRYTPLLAASLMLAALAPSQSRAAQNTWNNGSADFLWNGTSLNWAAPTAWVDGDDAIFGATGAGTINLEVPVAAHSLTFNAGGYILQGGGNTLTLSGTTPTIPTITANAIITNATTIEGTEGLIIEGAGTLWLTDDGLAGNHYTGGTHVKSGTLVLRNQMASTSGSDFAVDSIESLDAGATVMFGTVSATVDGTNSYARSVNGQIPIGGSVVTTHNLNLTGGTFDVNGEDNLNQVPMPSGTGTILNSSVLSRGVLKFTGYGDERTFSGIIKDGGPVTNSTITGKLAHRTDVDFQNGSGTIILAGSNSFTGFIRIGPANCTIQLSGAGTLGWPSSENCPPRQVLLNNGVLDLNGTSQKTGFFFSGANARVTNSAIGTLSTITLCYNCTNLTAPANSGIVSSLVDEPGVSGLIGITKEGVALQNLNGTANNYHGDTVVNNGTLRIDQPGAISPNSAYRLSTSQGTLELNYAGDALVRALYIDGVKMPPNTYDATTAPITGTGTITVPPPNTWNNAAADFLWDLTSANWTSPTIWADGASAIFGATGAGTVSLGSPIIAQDLSFNAAGYTLQGNGNALTLAGANSTITAGAGTSNYLGVSIYGTSAVTFDGPGTTVLGGDAAVPDANHYTGASYFRSGTVVLQAVGAGNGSTAGDSHAVESIEALDTGATLKFGPTFDGNLWVNTPGDQIGARIPGTKMIMTGGTLDLNNDSRSGGEPVRIPDGFGLIINNGSAVQSALNVVTDGGNHTFSGVIADGNNGALTGDNFAAGSTPQGPGYQIGVINIGSGGASGSTWTLAGDNTFSGSTRVENNTTVILAGNHSLGIPTLTNSLTGPMRLLVGSAIDFNGRNQTIALMTDSGGASGKMYNSKPGTVSTLTVGYGNENVQTRAAAPELMDNLGVGGKFAFRKIITQAYTYYNTNITSGEVITNVVTNCIQTLKANCVATYSGDTSVDGGTLKVQGPSAISPNSAYRLSTANYANLWLDYDGDAPVRQLWINGVQQPNGTYGAGTPGIDPTSTGTITVTGFAPATISAVQSGSNLNFSWDGVYKLQSSTNNVVGPYSDYVGAGLNAATVPINPNVGAVYFRLATY